MSDSRRPGETGCQIPCCGLLSPFMTMHTSVVGGFLQT